MVTLGQVTKFLVLPGDEARSFLNFLTSFFLLTPLPRTFPSEFNGSNTNTPPLNLPLSPSTCLTSILYVVSLSMYSSRRCWQFKIRFVFFYLDVSKLLVNTRIDQISLESTYDPEMMFDFEPELGVQGVRLIQQPIYDKEAELVSPWNAPSVFRKGALVAVEAHLSVYHFINDLKPSHVRFSSYLHAAVVH